MISRLLYLPSLLSFRRLAVATPLAATLVGATVVNAADAPVTQALRAEFSTAEVKPWGYWGTDRSIEGTLAVLTKRLEELTGIPIDNQIRPYARTIHEVEKGEVDFAVMFTGSSSERIGIDIGTVAEMDILVTGRPDQPMIDSLDDLKGQAVGYIRGALYGPAFDSVDSVEKLPVKDMAQGLQMLMIGRIQAMVGSDQALYYTLKEMDISPDQVKPLMVLDRTEGKLYFSRASQNTHLIEPFKKALQTLRESGELERIFALPGKPKSGS